MSSRGVLLAWCFGIALLAPHNGLDRQGGKAIALPPGGGVAVHRDKVWHRRTPGRAALLPLLRPALYTALLLLTLLPRWGGASDALLAITGLTATLKDEWMASPDGDGAFWTWQTHWVVQWQPVPGATHYDITLKTSEGISPRPISLATPSWTIEVAKGHNRRAAGMPTRMIQLLTIQGLLAVRVTPRWADGRPGPPSPWLPVGRVYAESSAVPGPPQDALLP